MNKDKMTDEQAIHAWETLIRLWCDQKGLTVKDIKIVKKEKIS